jgi:arginyl-tRNA synthetase
VVVKSDGDFTYFANDIAYHRLKFEEKYDLVIDILGSNHHGHVPRLQAVIGSLGYETEKFRVILYQWVRFKRGGELLKMSKRGGTFVTAREILDEVGQDALRFFILMYDAKTHIDFDLSLAREKSSKNPVYYVQYAHARISSILSKAKRLKTNVETKPLTANYELLTNSYELNLIKQISKFPELVEDVAESFAVNQLTTYATELADSFHKFYENVQVLTDKKELRDARLALIAATQITLANTLKLLGVSAPEKM